MIVSEKILLNGKMYEVEVLETSPSSVRFKLGEREFVCEVAMSATTSRVAPNNVSTPRIPTTQKEITTDGLAAIKAPIPGLVTEILVELGTKIAQGDVCLRLEAMKMQNAILSPIEGIVSAIHTSKGAEVSMGEVLIVIAKE